MSEPIPIDLDRDDGRLLEPPIIDFLVFDADVGGYVVEFVPDPSVSDEQKESVIVGRDTDTARRLRELLQVLAGLYGVGQPIDRIAFAGYDNFTFGAAAWQGALDESSSPQMSFDVARVIEVLSVEVQFEFIRQRRGETRRAG
jgi:hypothetical protein